MPIIKSAIKQLRQNKKRYLKNKSMKTKLKTTLRSYSDLINEKKAKEAEAALPNLYKTIDKVAKKNLMHKKTAARKKSLAARQLASLTAK